jgi:hypothetical protein
MMGEDADPLRMIRSSSLNTPPSSQSTISSPGRKYWPLCVEMFIAVAGDAQLVAPAGLAAAPSALTWYVAPHATGWIVITTAAVMLDMNIDLRPSQATTPRFRRGRSLQTQKTIPLPSKLTPDRASRRGGILHQIQDRRCDFCSG